MIHRRLDMSADHGINEIDSVDQQLASRLSVLCQLAHKCKDPELKTMMELRIEDIVRAWDNWPKC